MKKLMYIFLVFVGIDWLQGEKRRRSNEGNADSGN